MQPLDKMAAQIQAYREAWNSPEAKPITDVATNKVAAYTLVHCAETEQQARRQRRLGVGRVVVPEHRRSSPSTGSSRTSRTAEQEAAFPLLKPLMEGNIPIEASTRAT